MEPGNSLSHPGLGCVHLSPDNTNVSEIIKFAGKIGAIDRDGEELIIVRFPGESSDEAVTEEELKARLSAPLVNG